MLHHKSRVSEDQSVERSFYAPSHTPSEKTSDRPFKVVVDPNANDGNISIGQDDIRYSQSLGQVGSTQIHSTGHRHRNPEANYDAEYEDQIASKIHQPQDNISNGRASTPRPIHLSEASCIAKQTSVDGSTRMKVRTSKQLTYHRNHLTQNVVLDCDGTTQDSNHHRPRGVNSPGNLPVEFDATVTENNLGRQTSTLPGSINPDEDRFSIHTISRKHTNNLEFVNMNISCPGQSSNDMISDDEGVLDEDSFNSIEPMTLMNPMTDPLSEHGRTLVAEFQGSGHIQKHWRQKIQNLNLWNVLIAFFALVTSIAMMVFTILAYKSQKWEARATFRNDCWNAKVSLITLYCSYIN
jgi:hypothetical protein